MAFGFCNADKRLRRTQIMIKIMIFVEIHTITKQPKVLLPAAVTEDDPYIITSWEEYNHMQVVGCGDEGIGVHFKLATDLNEHSNFYGDAVRNESIGTIG